TSRLSSLSLHDALPIYAPQSAALAGCLNQRDLHIWRHGDVQHLNRRIIEQLVITSVNRPHGMPLRHLLRMLPRARGDGDRIEPRSEEHTSELQSPDHLV